MIHPISKESSIRTKLNCVFAAAESRVKIWSVKLMWAPGSFGCCPFWGGGSAVVYSLLLLPLFVVGLE